MAEKMICLKVKDEMAAHTLKFEDGLFW
jgi:hypothetical protein